MATGGVPASVTAASGNHDCVLAIKLDVTRSEDGQAAIDAAVAKFGRIDVLVNNAVNVFAGIRTMLVEPGFFRTELLSNDSTIYAQPAVGDCAEQTRGIVAAWKSMDGSKVGIPPSSRAQAHRERGPRARPRLTQW